MNYLIAVSITPIGLKEDTQKHVEEVNEVIANSGLTYLEHDLFTEIEGPYDDVMATVKNAAFTLAERGIRVVITMKGDIRPGYEKNMTGKLDRINDQLNKD